MRRNGIACMVRTVSSRLCPFGVTLKVGCRGFLITENITGIRNMDNTLSYISEKNGHLNLPWRKSVTTIHPITWGNAYATISAKDAWYTFNPNNKNAAGTI
jgi:hypothetical protein